MLSPKGTEFTAHVVFNIFLRFYYKLLRVFVLIDELFVYLQYNEKNQPHNQQIFIVLPSGKCFIHVCPQRAGQR